MLKAVKFAPLLLLAVLFGCGEMDDNGGTTTGGTTTGGTTTGGTTTGGTGVEDGLPPSGSFGVSLTQTGPLQNDADGDITSGSDARIAGGDRGRARIAERAATGHAGGGGSGAGAVRYTERCASAASGWPVYRWRLPRGQHGRARGQRADACRALAAVVGRLAHVNALFRTGPRAGSSARWP